MDDILLIMQELLDEAELRDQYTDVLLGKLEDTTDNEEKAEIVGNIIMLNEHLITKYAAKTNYMSLPSCEFKDAVSILTATICAALLEGKIKVWATDFPNVFGSAVDSTKREIADKYSEGGIKMSYSTRNRRIHDGKLFKVSTIYVGEGVDINPDIEKNETQTSLEEDYERKELARMVHDVTDYALNNKVISRFDYDIIMDHVVNGVSFVDIAANLGMQDTAVRMRYRRARNKIKDVFYKLYPDIEAFMY